MAPVRERPKPAVSKSVEVLQGEPEIVACFPREHRSSVRSTKAIEPGKAGVDRRATMLGIFPCSERVAASCVKMR